jgi:hypothetical protein
MASNTSMRDKGAPEDPHFNISATTDSSSSWVRSGRRPGLTAGLDAAAALSCSVDFATRAFAAAARTGTPFLSSMSAVSSRRSSRVGFFALFTGAMATGKKAMGAVATETSSDGGNSAGQPFLILGAKFRARVKHSGLNRLARTDFVSEQRFAL